MPELPEVEVICRGIRPYLINRTVRDIYHSGKQLRHTIPIDEMNQKLLKHKVVAVERRAKYLMIRFDNSALLLFHFGMTGNLGIFAPDTPIAKHDHLRMLLDNNTELRLNDTRRFGSIDLIADCTKENLEDTFFATTGPEPFSDDFSGKALKKMASKKSLPVKTYIMTNLVVAGVGNIYANESLFAAGIRPSRRVNQISLQSWNRLAGEIRRVLAHAIDCGGSTISDFVNASQETGYFQMNFKVYGKEGEKCTLCSSLIKKQVIGGRATFFCPTCQR